MTSKKAFFFILLLSLFALFFGAKKGVFKKQKTEASYSRKKDGRKVKSSCREVLIKEKNPNKKATNIQKLTALMDKPIDWVFTDIDGQVIDLYCLRGKIILINFWAGWCAPCIQELPSLSELAETYKEDIFVAAISTEPLETVKNFLKQSFPDLSLRFRVAQMSENRKAMYFPEDKLPVTYIFDKKGLLKWKELGAKDWSNQQLVRQILRL